MWNIVFNTLKQIVCNTNRLLMVGLDCSNKLEKRSICVSPREGEWLGISCDQSLMRKQCQPIIPPPR